MAIKLVVKKDLKEFFPKEFTNRELIGKFIDYVMNHFFQTSAEEYINGYIGKKTVAVEKGDFYINESSNERQSYQLTPSLVTVNSENNEIQDIVEYCNFINTLKLQGCDTNDQNRLLSSECWSWCPPINIDMFLNYNFYYWIEEGVTPIELIGKTNIIMDIIGQKNYTYKNKDDSDEEAVEFMSGLRVVFKNDENPEYNDKIFIVEGVGDSITLINDENILHSDNIEPDYFVMERGCIDGNAWSLRNRWFHRSVISKMTANESKKYHQAKKPIICFNKDMELYNYGSYNRGYVDLLVPSKKSDIHGLAPQPIQGVVLEDGMTILLTGDTNPENNNRIYQISGISNINTVVLQPVINGKSSTGESVDGEGIMIKRGRYKDSYYYYEDYEWKLGQQKNNINQSPLFQLYDENKVKFSNTLYYPQSSFAGSKIFDYVTTDEEGVEYDDDLNRYILTAGYGNYKFDNILTSQSITYNDYDSIKTYEGFKFFKINGQDTYLNNWYLSKDNSSQYIVTEIKVTDNKTVKEFTDDNGLVSSYVVYDLAYQPDKSDNRKSSFVYLNGSLINEKTDYIIENKQLMITSNVSLSVDDTLYVKLLVNKLNETIADGYYFDLPLTLTANALNGSITDIKYSECFDQLKSIIENQSAFEGDGSGYNNYVNTRKDLSLGTEILQHSNPILKTMLLNSKEYTNIRNVLEYIKNEYSKFKTKFITVITSMSNNGEYTEESELSNVIITALERINIGKEGINAFYNNGVATEFGNCYIPATPAYLGLDNCYVPEIVEVTENNKTMRMLLCHDGSYNQLFNDYRDSALLRLEQSIYESIPNKWKNSRPVFNKYKLIPGKFRKTSYNHSEYVSLMATFLESWANENNIDYTTNSNFDYSDAFTWNYSTCVDQDGEPMFGSYRAIYQYYYDTYRPHTHPWEMLGFGSMPSWWENRYGKAPYNSSNIPMWKDIENGYVAEGENQGYHEEFKRPNLVEKYLPVDERGNLVNPVTAGIVTKAPIAYYAGQSWVAGDMGEVETIWKMTPEYRYALQAILYLMRPIEWVETNWDTINRTVLFEGSDYEQVIYSDTVNRPMPSQLIMHNELINNEYVCKIGIQQWISDYLINENINVTSYIAEPLRNVDIRLSYRCGRFYKKDSIKILSDNYGVLPSQNYHMGLYKSKTNKQASYSAMVITKVNNGYMLDGYNLSYPYFKVMTPILTGKKTPVEINGKNVIYYNNWNDDVKEVKYKTVFSSVQELFNVICGYGKYLEDVEGWVFDKVLSSSGTVIDFTAKAEDFVKWISANPQNGQLIMLNPGFNGMTIKHDAFLDVVGQYINGNWSVTDTVGNPIYNNELRVYRHNGYTEINSDDKVITSLKVNIVENEHIILFDNKTIYGDILYDPLLCVKTHRLKVIGIGVLNWDGTLYAPGYLVGTDGAIANYDKLVEDFKYFFDTDDVRAQGIFGDYAKKTVGYKKNPVMERLLIDDRNMFDFYKGMLREKGTRRSFGKLNRSKYVMNSNDSSIDLYENWAFKIGEFGHVLDNYLMEFKIDTSKVTQDPQIVAFTTANREENTKDKNSIIEIYWNDKEWIEKLSTKDKNTFEFSDVNRYYPVGGFAQPTDVNYLVANMDEFENVKDNIKLNETIWVVKKENKDWDIFKKVEDGYMSMRVDNLNELHTFDTSKLIEGDLVYVTRDILTSHLEHINDPENLLRQGQNIIDRLAWSIFKFNGESFELYRVQNRLPDLKKMDKCFMINDENDETLSSIQLYDPMQGLFPNKVMDEINYISAIDPVLDYNDFYKWGDEKVGYLWWDLSKVRYLDYHQGDIYYRRNNWGKQLPGSEIAIYEWTVSNTKPSGVNKFVEKELYNYETSTYDTYYYYWVKNPVEIPNVDFRHKSALTISQIINSPQDEGILWFAPIFIGTETEKYSAFVIGNFDTVSAGSDFVVQMNFRTSVDLNEHVEWVLVREGDDDAIPTRLWDKMKASLIGYDSIGQIIPDPMLDDRNKIGINIRPRQTMFESMYTARLNLVDVINDIFNHRDVMVSTDVGTAKFDEVFKDRDTLPESDFDPFESHYDMQTVEDVELIGKKLLVLNDENYGGIWTLWKMEAVGKFTLLDYQKYNVQSYWEYKDLYRDESAMMTQPLKTFDSEIEMNDYFYNNVVMEGEVFKVYTREGIWELYEFKGMKGSVPVLQKIGMQNGTINITSKLYDFLNDKDDSEFIDGMTKYEYLTQESATVIEKIIAYFEN